jgi:hypothetical protein
VRAHTLPATDFFHDTQEKNSKISTKRRIKRRTLSSVVIPTGPCFERTQTAAKKFRFKDSEETRESPPNLSQTQLKPRFGGNRLKLAWLLVSSVLLCIQPTADVRGTISFRTEKKKEKLQPGPTQPHAIDEVIVVPCESLQPRQRRHEYPLRRGNHRKKKGVPEAPLTVTSTKCSARTLDCCIQRGLVNESKFLHALGDREKKGRSSRSRRNQWHPSVSEHDTTVRCKHASCGRVKQHSNDHSP